MKVLDCTLRDGGYYNDWHFDTALVEKYLAVMAHARVDYVELGFRIPASDRFLGACAYTTEGYLASLNVPQGLALGVMINAKDYDSAAHLNEFFVPAAQSRVRLVRVAAHLGEVAKALEFVRHLNGMGYTVGLNLMQMGVHDGATVRAALAQIGQERALDVLYFADSLGNMEEKEVREAVALLRESYTGVLGVHAHNNLGQALRNTLEALALGVDWLDSTVAGMGRGAGNTPTELLLTELNGRDGRHFPLEGLYLLAMEEFAALKATYGWGPDLLYYLAAKHRIHPTYIQLLKTEGGLDNHDVVNALSALKGIDCTSYRKLDLNQLIYNAPTSAPAPAPAPAREDLTGGRDVLVIANGASLGAYAREVVGFAKKQGLCVLSLNVNQWVGDDVVNLYTLCNPARILANTDRLRGLSGKVLMPAATGFMPTAVMPDRRAACSRAQTTWVLPTPVSVPVTKNACRMVPPVGSVVTFRRSAKPRRK